MNKPFFLASMLFLAFFAGTSFAESNPLDKKMETVLSAMGEDLNIGILVQDAKTAKVLYQKNINRYFMPASNQKLFTAFAALQTLGPDYSFRTQLFADYTRIKNNTLRDNLYLQFSGDPSLTLTQLDLLINSLVQTGVNRINGDIIIDDTAFDQMSMSPGTAWEDQNFCWGAPVSALIINHNCVNATLIPAQAEQPALLKLPDYPQSMQFVNQVITGAATAKNCLVKVSRSDETTYTLSGCIKAASKAQYIERAIASPKDNMRVLLHYLLTKNQIKLKGKIEFRAFAITTKPFAIQSSPPLKKLVTTMLKESDNTIADALFKTMGANYAHEAGSYKNGSKAVRTALAKMAQLTLPKTTLVDGAGSSHYNFLTPEQVVFLLQKIFSSPGASDYLASLAISGVDGTLKTRMKGPLTLGKIHAKTGSLTGVTTLSGYLKTQKNQTLIFSIMINGFIGPVSKYLALEDKICSILIEAN